MKKIHEKLVRFFDSKVFVGVLYGIGLVLILVLVFSAGISVGFHKASFNRAWGENYERNFGIPRNGMMGRFGNGPGGRPEDFPNAHGTVGKIIKIELPNIIVADNNNTEKIVVLESDTRIQERMNEIKPADLLINDFIVVIGSPNDQGQIQAKFIRVMPAGMPNPKAIN